MIKRIGNKLLVGKHHFATIFQVSDFNRKGAYKWSYKFVHLTVDPPAIYKKKDDIVNALQPFINNILLATAVTTTIKPKM